MGLLCSRPARSEDWDSCRSTLSDLRSHSGDASSKAEEVSEAETKLRHCRDDDDKSDCKSETRHYQNAKEELESALEDVQGDITSASSLCGFDLSKPRTLADIKARLCRALLRQKPYMPTSSLLSSCKQGMTEEECKKCLGIK